MTFAIDRLEGGRGYTIATEDLVGAAHSLRPQLDALNEAGEGTRKPTIDRHPQLGQVRGQRAVHLEPAITTSTTDPPGG